MSVIKFEDEERYKTVANELHGYGRNTSKVRTGNSNMTFSKRTDLKVKDYIQDSKETGDKYRNDPYCNLI
jgi:hypothetical protein